VVRWLTLLLHIRDVPGSNISPETGCPDWAFPGFFFQFLQANAGIVPSVRPRPLLSTSFSFHLSPFHLMLCSLKLLKKHL
jgi:hypothetical protein